MRQSNIKMIEVPLIKTDQLYAVLASDLRLPGNFGVVLWVPGKAKVLDKHTTHTPVGSQARPWVHAVGGIKWFTLVLNSAVVQPIVDHFLTK